MGVNLMMCTKKITLRRWNICIFDSNYFIMNGKTICHNFSILIPSVKCNFFFTHQKVCNISKMECYVETVGNCMSTRNNNCLTQTLVGIYLHLPSGSCALNWISIRNFGIIHSCGINLARYRAPKYWPVWPDGSIIFSIFGHLQK